MSDITAGPAPATTRSPASAAIASVAKYPGRWAVFAVVLLADVMDLVDSTVTNVGGPAIRESLGGGQSLLQWLGAGYTLAFAVFLITGARLGDLYGRRRLFLIGAAGFTVASALCALAWSPESLIVTRVLQGAFGALMIPQGFGMLTEVLDEKDMPKAFGLFGPIMGLSAVAGPIIGAALIQGDLLGAGWRTIFLVNVPLGLVCIAVGARYMPRNVTAKGGGLDLMGMTLIGFAALALIYPLIEGRELGWPLWTFALMVAGVALAVAFVVYERRLPAQRALIQMSLMRNRSFTSGMAVATGFFAAFSGVMLVLSLFWQVGEGFSPIRAALSLAPMSVGMIVGMGLSFALIARLGRRLVHTGISVTTLGLAGHRRDGAPDDPPVPVVDGAVGLHRRRRRRHGVRSALRRRAGRRHRDGGRLGLGAAQRPPAARLLVRHRARGDDLLRRPRRAPPGHRRPRAGRPAVDRPPGDQLRAGLPHAPRAAGGGGPLITRRRPRRTSRGSAPPRARSPWPAGSPSGSARTG